MKQAIALTQKETIALYCLIALLTIPPVNALLNDILQLGLNRGSISPISYGFMGVVGLYSYRYLRNIRPVLIVMMIITILLSLLSYLLYPNIREVFITDDFNPLTSALIFLPLYAFPTLICSYYCTPFIEIFLQKIRWISLAWIALGIFDYVFVVLNGHYFEVNYMTFSYNLLPAVCFSGAIGFKEKKIVDIIASFSGLLFILIGGSRGCFGCGVFFYCLLFFKLYGINIKKLVLFALLLLVVISLIFHFSSTFIDSVSDILEEHGATSRTLLKITEGTVGESDSRAGIYIVMRNAIWNNPIGYGLFGDRYIMKCNGYGIGYAHSIIWESLVDFGPFLGSIFLVAFFLKLYKSIKKTMALPCYEVLIAFVSLGVIKLFMSGSFLEEFFFFATVGLIFNKKIYAPN